MNLYILPNTSQVVTMTSREIAELTGKDLSHIHRDTRAMLDELAGNDDPDLDHVREDKDARNYTTCFHLPKSLTITLMAGYSVKMRHAIVKRWQELETKQSAPAELSRMDILTLAMESEKGRLLAIEQRDHAIATKAQIGSKREATAMATASAAKKESASLKEQLGFGAHFATVTAVQNATGEKFDWLPMRRWCKDHSQAPNDVQDKRYGTVKAWPAGAWANCYGVDLMDLFGEVAA